MNADQVEMLRSILSASGWLDRAGEFARALRTSARDPGALMLLGTPEDEPWHLAAHLDDESRLGGLPGLTPTLVRWRPPAGAPPHLRVGLDRLREARRGQALFVVAEDAAPAPMLERVEDVRRSGATVLTLDGGDRELEGLAHQALTVPAEDRLVSFDGAQHLVSAAAGRPEPVSRPRGIRRGGGATLRDRLARVLEAVSGPPVHP